MTFRLFSFLSDSRFSREPTGTLGSSSPPQPKTPRIPTGDGVLPHKRQSVVAHPQFVPSSHFASRSSREPTRTLGSSSPPQPKTPRIPMYPRGFGRGDGVRTHDLSVPNAARYQLRYASTSAFQEERARFRAPLSSFGGDNEIRTRGLYVANVPLYQLSHIPESMIYYIPSLRFCQ